MLFLTPYAISRGAAYGKKKTMRVVHFNRISNTQDSVRIFRRELTFTSFHERPTDLGISALVRTHQD